MNDLLVIMPSFKAGGAQRVLSILMNEIAEKGGKVELLLLKKGAPVEYELNYSIQVKKCEIERKNIFIRVFSEIKAIRNELKKHKGCNCISFITMYNLYTIIAGFALDNHIIVSERVDPSKSLPSNSIWLHWLRNYLYSKAKCVVFQTKDEQKYFANVKGIKGVIIPNPLSKNLPVKENYDDKLNFISVARLENQKNYPMMMDAIDIVVDEIPEAHLLIYGKGSQEEALKEYHAHIRHSENVKFMGFTNDVPTALMNAYAFVSSSDYEGISNSMIEAMAIGVPCICTDCPGGGTNEYIINGYNGILVPVGNANALAQNMIMLTRDNAFRKKLGKNAIEIREKLNVNIILKQWIEIME